MNPHEKTTRHHLEVEAAEAADGPHVPDSDPERVRKALRLLDRLERMAAEYGGSGPRAAAARIVALGEVAEAALEELGKA